VSELNLRVHEADAERVERIRLRCLSILDARRREQQTRRVPGPGWRAWLELAVAVWWVRSIWPAPSSARSRSSAENGRRGWSGAKAERAQSEMRKKVLQIGSSALSRSTR
jgi:hypothetical protein